MHIAWLGKKTPFCGNVTYSREVTNALLTNHQVSFLHFAQEDSTPDHWPGCPEVPLPFLYKSQVYTIPTFKSSKVLIQSLRDLKPDLVHASLSISPLDFLLPEICEELNLPLVATFHTAYARKGDKLKSGTQFLAYQLYAPFLANYDQVVVFSEIQRELLVKMAVPPERVAVIPNGVDVQKYSPGPSSLKSEFEAERIFVYQGRIAPEKNVEALLKAWRQAKMGPKCKLLIVGDGPLRLALEPFYDAEHGIIWLGYVADEQRRIDILRGSDVFILPSLAEGLSLSLLEAMACGVACVATDVGADGEVLEDGTGVVVNPQRVKSELQTLLPLLRDHPEFTARLGQKARTRVLERYTLNANIAQLEKLYDQVLQQPRLMFSHRA